MKSADDVAADKMFLLLWPKGVDPAIEIYEAVKVIITSYADEKMSIVRQDYEGKVIPAIQAEARNAALDEAARLCKQLASELDTESTDKVFNQKFKQVIKGMNGSIVAEVCEARVLALKSPETKETK